MEYPKRNSGHLRKTDIQRTKGIRMSGTKNCGTAYYKIACATIIKT